MQSPSSFEVLHVNCLYDTLFNQQAPWDEAVKTGSNCGSFISYTFLTSALFHQIVSTLMQIFSVRAECHAVRVSYVYHQ